MSIIEYYKQQITKHDDSITVINHKIIVINDEIKKRKNEIKLNYYNAERLIKNDVTINRLLKGRNSLYNARRYHKVKLADYQFLMHCLNNSTNERGCKHENNKND